MVDLSEFESISPYTDAEAAEAISKLAEFPLLSQVSQQFFPEEEPEFLKNLLKQIKTIDDFQILVMQKFVRWVLEHTAKNFSYDGVSNIDPEKKFLALSNHRDIILDPAITQLILYTNGIPMTEIAVGDNLITNKTIEYLIRSNRMIKVVRGISARELYLSSQLLSKYIRLNITEQRSSIWLAQRQGRTKNGYDITEQGLLKMLDMSGKADFQTNFEELNIIPMSISYEYEPCDILKARELVISFITVVGASLSVWSQAVKAKTAPTTRTSTISSDVSFFILFPFLVSILYFGAQSVLHIYFNNTM